MVIQMQKALARKIFYISSAHLERVVTVECYIPTASLNQAAKLLLINDGQDLEKMEFYGMLDRLISTHAIEPLVCVGIHASEQRKMEYGTAHTPDCKGRGARADAYSRFVLDELIPLLPFACQVESFTEKALAGFSLGGLSALDIAWNHPDLFNKVGVFSGSLWWRKKDLDEGYDEEHDRIMHSQIRGGNYHPSLKFFFQAGTEDETADRNNNGIIDAIDDTLGLINELEKKGYELTRDIVYLELQGGKHDVETWGQAMPTFLEWGWSIKTNYRSHQ